MSWTVLQVFCVTFLRSKSKSHPSEKPCGSLTVHLLVSQVLSPVLQSALTLGFADSSGSPDFEASPLLLGLCLFMGRANAEDNIIIWVCVKMPLCHPTGYQSMQRFLPKQLHQWLSSWTLILSLTELSCPNAVYLLTDSLFYTSMRWS